MPWILPLIVLSCTSSKGTPGDAGTTDDTGPQVSCEHDPRVDTYVANLTETSADGTLKVTLVSSDPAPPAINENTWVVKVADGSGTPMPNANLTVAAFMPDHGHGATVKATITPRGDGTFEVKPLVLFMPGVWRVTFSVGGPDGGPAPSVAFFFCVEG